MIRCVDEKELVRRARAVASGRSGLTAFVAWVGRQPRAPRLVARKEAAAILGTQSPNISKFQAAERMPEAVPVEGGAPVYVREEVEAFAEELAEERAARAARREAA